MTGSSFQRKRRGNDPDDRLNDGPRPDTYGVGLIKMASALKPSEMEPFRVMLDGLRARLRGDLNQMTDEALRRDQPDSSGNLSNVPLHMADVGTENYDQEFTLSLIENEQETLEQVYDALRRIEKGSFGACEECGEQIAKPRLQAIPYARHCIGCARELEKRG
jgi:DnaK suppressor protein